MYEYTHKSLIKHIFNSFNLVSISYFYFTKNICYFQMFIKQLACACNRYLISKYEIKVEHKKFLKLKNILKISKT